MTNGKESPRPSYLSGISIPHETNYATGHAIIQSMLVGELEKVALIDDLESFVADGCSVGDQLLDILAHFERQKLRSCVVPQAQDAVTVRALDIDFKVVGYAVLGE